MVEAACEKSPKALRIAAAPEHARFQPNWALAKIPNIGSQGSGCLCECGVPGGSVSQQFRIRTFERLSNPLKQKEKWLNSHIDVLKLQNVKNRFLESAIGFPGPIPFEPWKLPRICYLCHLSHLSPTFLEALQNGHLESYL